MEVVAALKSISEGPRNDPEHGRVLIPVREKLGALSAKLEILAERAAEPAPLALPEEAPAPPPVQEIETPVQPADAPPATQTKPVQLELDFGDQGQTEGQSLGSSSPRMVSEERRIVEDVTRQIARVYPVAQREDRLGRLGILEHVTTSEHARDFPVFARAYFAPSADFGVAVASASSLENIGLLEELMVSQANKMLIVYMRGPVDTRLMKEKNREYKKKFEGRIRLVSGADLKGQTYGDFILGLARGGGKFADSVRRVANQWYRKSGREGNLTKNRTEFLKFLTVVADEKEFTMLELPFVTPFYSKDFGLTPGAREFAESFYAVLGSGISEAARLKKQVGDDLDLRLSRDGLKVEGLALNENSMNRYLELMTVLQSARTVLQQAA